MELVALEPARPGVEHVVLARQPLQREAFARMADELRQVERRPAPDVLLPHRRQHPGRIAEREDHPQVGRTELGQRRRHPISRDRGEPLAAEHDSARGPVDGVDQLAPLAFAAVDEVPRGAEQVAHLSGDEVDVRLAELVAVGSRAPAGRRSCRSSAARCAAPLDPPRPARPALSSDNDLAVRTLELRRRPRLVALVRGLGSPLGSARRGPCAPRPASRAASGPMRRAPRPTHRLPPQPRPPRRSSAGPSPARTGRGRGRREIRPRARRDRAGLRPTPAPVEVAHAWVASSTPNGAYATCWASRSFATTRRTNAPYLRSAGTFGPSSATLTRRSSSTWAAPSEAFGVDTSSAKPVGSRPQAVREPLPELLGRAAGGRDGHHRDLVGGRWASHASTVAIRSWVSQKWSANGARAITASANSASGCANRCFTCCCQLDAT